MNNKKIIIVVISILLLIEIIVGVITKCEGVEIIARVGLCLFEIAGTAAVIIYPKNN